MKILYVHPRAWSGEYSLLKMLARQGHQVSVLEYDRKLARTRQLTFDFLEQGDGIATLWYNPRRGIERLLTWPMDFFFKRVGYRGNLGHRMWLILAAARRFKPDALICSEGFGYGVAASMLKRLGLLKPPLVVGFLGGDLLDCLEADVGVRRNKYTLWLFRQVHAGADILRPLSPLLASILLKEKAPPKKIHVCPAHLVADIAVLQEIYRQRNAVSKRIRAKYGIAEETPTIVSLSGNDKGKGIHLLAEAWPTIKQQVKDCQWILCGPMTPWVEQQVLPRVKGYEDSVHLTGSLKGIDVFEHLACADVNVNPTLCDGLNMVTVEAAAVGTPTIVTDHAGISAWIQKTQAGEVVPVGSARAIADAVIYFFSHDASQRAAYGGNAHRMADEFSMDSVAEKLIGIVNHAMSSGISNSK